MWDRFALLVCLITFWGQGCTEPDPEADLRIDLVTAALASACIADTNNDGAFPSGVDSVVIRLTGGELAAPFVKRLESSQGESAFVVTGITPGEGMTLDVIGCNQDAALWAGLRQLPPFRS